MFADDVKVYAKIVDPSDVHQLQRAIDSLVEWAETWHLPISINKCYAMHIGTHTHTHPFNGPLSGTTRVSQYQKGKTNLDFSEARDSEWQWNPLGHIQVCTSLQTDNHANTSLLSFLQAGCPSCRPTNSVKALKAKALICYICNNRLQLCTTCMQNGLIMTLWSLHSVLRRCWLGGRKGIRPVKN